MKETELHGAKPKPADLTHQYDQVDAKILSRPDQVAPKLGCLKSKDFFLSPDFDEVDVGFDQVTRLWG